MATGRSGFWIGEVGTGAGERVDCMGVGQVLHRDLLQGREPLGVAGLWGWRLLSKVSWQRLGSLHEVTEGSSVKRSLVEGSKEGLWKPSLRIHLRWWRPG